MDIHKNSNQSYGLNPMIALHIAVSFSELSEQCFHKIELWISINRFMQLDELWSSKINNGDRWMDYGAPYINHEAP